MAAGCGSSDTTSQTKYNTGSGNESYKPTTHLLHRALVTNYYSSVLNVMDATQNRLTSYTFAVGTLPSYMQSSPDGTLTLVNNSGANTISSFNNSQEVVKGTVSLGGYTQSFVTSTDNESGFAAVPNYSNGTYRDPGAVVRFNPTDGSTLTQVQLPNAEYLGMDTAEKHLMVFTSTDSLAYWVDLTNNDASTGVPVWYQLSLKDSSGNAVTLSRPTAVYFSSDSTKAYVLSCGPECGGTSAPTVAVIDTSSISPSTTTSGTVVSATVTNIWSVKGARTGIIDTTNNILYVAGSSGTTSTDSGGYTVLDGWFSSINLASTTSTPSTIAIGPGYNRILRKIGSNFWVGARNCGVTSCLTIVKSGLASATVLSTANGNATGITQCTNTGDVYTVEGGEFYFYNTSGTALTSEYQVNVTGQITDVLYID